MITEWTDPWSDDSICLLRDIPCLRGWPRVINAKRIHGIYLVVYLMVRSVPSSSVPLPLYKPASVILTFYFYRNFTIRALPSSLTNEYTVHLIHPSSTLCCYSSSISKHPSPPAQISYLLTFYHRHIF